MSFEQYDLSPDLLNGLVDTRIEKPTPLQQEVIPQALEGKHLLVKNESEDNGAFLIPALQKLIANGEVNGTRILILTPSIERAKAIDEMIWAMGYHAQVSSTSLSMKGDKVAQEQAVLDEAPVIVANPGRLVDILEKTKKTFTDLECVVIDEAHNMENFSLVGRVKSIFEFIENQPQVLIFSGTMNNATKQLAENALKNPELIGFQSTDIEEKKAVEPAEIDEEEVKEKLEQASVKVVLNPEEKKDNKESEKIQNQDQDGEDDKEVKPAVIDQKEVEAKLEKASVKVVLNPEKKEPENKTDSGSDSDKAPVEKLKEASVSVVLKKDQTDEPSVPKNLEQGYINVPPRMKISTLMAHLENSKVERILVFTASKRTADRLFRIILKKSWGVVSVDESINKETFNERFQKFTSNEMKILIVGGMSATDIEIDKVTQVINYDVPNEVEEYRYRAELVGSKKAGQMVSLVSKMDRDDIEKITNEVGYAPEEIKLPEEVKKKKKGKNSNNKKRNNKQSKPHNKTRRSSSNNKKAKKKKETADNSYGLPRPSYDGLSGGREGDRSGGVFGWVKKLFN
ncbi:DEAD/DEAH box helicase [bacterium]|nr:DEAD/DEAH box helicase [Balneola sp.]MBR9917354.1 DEAD/DEAH box helicase [bacterium]